MRRCKGQFKKAQEGETGGTSENERNERVLLSVDDEVVAAVDVGELEEVGGDEDGQRKGMGPATRRRRRQGCVTVSPLGRDC